MTDLTNAPAVPPPRAPTEPDRLPVVDDVGTPVTRPREARRQARRRFLQMVGAIVVGTGLAFTDALSTRFARPAGAAPYEMWSTCVGYFDSSTTCVPSTAFYGDNCDGDWHRQARWVFPPFGGWGASTIADFVHLGETCSGRNAWLWRWVPEDRYTKCSDGTLTVWYSTGTIVYSVFSICRTTYWA